MTDLSALYAALRDGTGQDPAIDQAMNIFTPTVEGYEAYVRAVTVFDSDAIWALASVEGHEWTLPVAEERDGVNGFAVTGWVGNDSPVTEWHAERPRAICMLAVKLRMEL